LEFLENYVSGLMNILSSIHRSVVINKDIVNFDLASILVEAAEEDPLLCRARILQLMCLIFTKNSVEDSIFEDDVDFSWE